MSNFLNLLLSFVGFCIILTSCEKRPPANPLIRTDIKAHAADFKIVFGSCILSPSSKIWNTIQGVSPDLFLLLGDNIYLSDDALSSFAKIEAAYRYHFSQPELAKLLHSVPTFAIWDDHEFGHNNSDSTFKFKDYTLRAFREQWPNRPPPAALSDGIAFKIELPSFDIFMTDNRSYRINAQQNKQGTYFGEKQLAWLESEIIASKKVFSIVASGNQLLSSPGTNEALRQYPEEHKRFIELLKRAPHPVIVISGDIHYASFREVKSGEKLVPEITSSPLTAFSRKEPMTVRDEFHVANLLGENNFGEIVLSKKGDQIELSAAILSASGKKEIFRQYTIVGGRLLTLK